jgi:hypothetical protein
LEEGKATSANRLAMNTRKIQTMATSAVSMVRGFYHPEPLALINAVEVGAGRADARLVFSLGGLIGDVEAAHAGHSARQPSFGGTMKGLRGAK